MEKILITAENILEVARDLPEFELREVLDFVGYLKSRRNQNVANKIASDADLDWAEFEKGAGLWTGKFVRAECYDRQILR